MAKGEHNKFIVYRSWRDILETLDDDEAGLLFKGFFALACDGEFILDKRSRIGAILLSWKGIIQANDEKWHAQSKLNAEHGREGGLKTQANARKKKADALANEANASFQEPNESEYFENQAVMGKENGTVKGIDEGTVKGIPSHYERVDQIYQIFNRITSLHFSPKNDTQREQFWKLAELLFYDPYDDHEVELTFWEMWQKVSNDTSLMPKCTPFDFIRGDLLEDE